MINISKLCCDQVTPGDWIRYGMSNRGTAFQAVMHGQDVHATNAVPAMASERRPVIVWNITRACNLKCVHCYNDSGVAKAEDELTTQQAKEVLNDLAGFNVPSVLFSGGEPLTRSDLFELTEYAAEMGLRVVISTNGTLITEEKASLIKQHGVSYVGISLDGIGEVNDKFRGVKGAFDKAVEGIKNCQAAGVRVGLRLTLTQRNVQELEGMFDFFEKENIERVCFYHFVPSGRGGQIADDDLTHAQSRAAIDNILAKAKLYKQAGRTTDILTVDNHVDGVYLYLRLKEQSPERAENVWKLLSWNGGGLYSSGVGIGCIDFHGHVHPDQFWGHYTLGNVKQRPFSEIWTDTSEPLMAGLKNRRDYIKGRCRLCKFFDVCGGSLRVRADLHFNDPWAPDPGCYLTDDEIGLDESKRRELREKGEHFRMPD